MELIRDECEALDKEAALMADEVERERLERERERERD
jgi:hypothetical protein